jgi:hypothetical protein
MSLVNIVDVAFSLHFPAKIVGDLEKTASKRFRYAAESDATAASKIPVQVECFWVILVPLTKATSRAQDSVHVKSPGSLGLDLGAVV